MREGAEMISEIGMWMGEEPWDYKPGRSVRQGSVFRNDAQKVGELHLRCSTMM